MTDWLIPHRAVTAAVAAFEATCEKQGAVDDTDGQFEDCMYAAMRAALPLLRPLEATYTAAEVKVLTEAALRLGRKEALDEVAESAKSRLAEAQEAIPGPDGEYSIAMVARATAFREIGAFVQDLASLPSSAASDATSVPSEGPGTSEPSKAAKTPEPANPTVDLVGALRKAVDAARERRLAEREDRA